MIVIPEWIDKSFDPLMDLHQSKTEFIQVTVNTFVTTDQWFDLSLDKNKLQDVPSDLSFGIWKYGYFNIFMCHDSFKTVILACKFIRHMKGSIDIAQHIDLFNRIYLFLKKEKPC